MKIVHNEKCSKWKVYKIKSIQKKKCSKVFEIKSVRNLKCSKLKVFTMKSVQN